MITPIKQVVEQEQDIERLRRIALLWRETLVALTAKQAGPDNYVCEAAHYGKMVEVAEGTKDYCIGYAEGRRYDGEVRVRVKGGMVVWPEEEWGEDPNG